MFKFRIRFNILLNRIRRLKLLVLLFRKKLRIKDLCVELTAVGSTKPIAVLLYFNYWKKEFIADYFPDYNLYYLNKSNHKKHYLNWLVQQDFYLIIWGYNDHKNDQKLFDKSNRIIRVEDGFLRSFDIGIKKSIPMSLAIDFTGLYFNAKKASDLEHLLNHYDFTSNEINEARRAIALIKQYGISKYNHAPKLNLNSIIGPKKKKRILVIGQVENDASIRYGCERDFTNNDLVKLAYQENPDCEIIYKIHPDVLAMLISHDASDKEIDHLCTIISENIAPFSLFSEIDKVYTITSLMGFEALLFGLPVVCIGAPFYSNWGLTDDRQIIPRRTRARTIEEVFCAAYILYARYPYGDILSTIAQLAGKDFSNEKTKSTEEIAVLP